MNYEFVARLLEDPRVQARVNVQSQQGKTAFHYACRKVHESEAPAIIQRLLQVGADLTIKNAQGKTPLDLLQESAKLGRREGYFLVKARRLVMAATRTTAPSFLQGRVASGLPLPGVTLAPMAEDQGDDDDVEDCKLRSMLIFLVRVDGGSLPSGRFRPADAFLGPVAT